MSAPSPVGEAGVCLRPWSLAEYIEGPEVDFVVDQDLFVGAVVGVDTRHFLVLGVEVVEAPVHHSDSGGLGDRVVFVRAQYNL